MQKLLELGPLFGLQYVFLRLVENWFAARDLVLELGRLVNMSGVGFTPALPNLS